MLSVENSHYIGLTDENEIVFISLLDNDAWSVFGKNKAWYCDNEGKCIIDKYRIGGYSDLKSVKPIDILQCISTYLGLSEI